MGQQEVYDWFTSRYLSGDLAYYSVKEVYQLNNKLLSYNSIKEACKNLYFKGRFIERKLFNNVPKYRCNRSMI